MTEQVCLVCLVVVNETIYINWIFHYSFYKKKDLISAVKGSINSPGCLILWKIFLNSVTATVVSTYFGEKTRYFGWFSFFVERWCIFMVLLNNIRLDKINYFSAYNIIGTKQPKRLLFTPKNERWKTL